MITEVKQFNNIVNIVTIAKEFFFLMTIMLLVKFFYNFVYCVLSFFSGKLMKLKIQLRERICDCNSTMAYKKNNRTFIMRA